MRSTPLLLLCLLVAGCVEESIGTIELTPVDRVVLVVPAPEILVGDTLRLLAVGVSAQGDTLRGRQVTWRSSDSGVIAVTPGGYAIGLSEGRATLSAVIEGRQDTLTVDGVFLTFTSISAGYHSCGVTVAGSTWCWGDRSRGALGNGDTTAGISEVPRRVDGGPVLRSVTTANHSTCGLSIDDSLWCWGQNESGQLGDGTTSTAPSQCR